MKKSIVVIVQKIIARVVLCWTTFRPLTNTEKEFIKINSSFWKQYKPEQEVYKNKYIFVVPEQYPLIMVGNTHIASFIAKEKKLKLLFLVRSRFCISVKKVLSSFPNVVFIYEDNVHYLFFRVYSFFQARCLIRKLKEPKDILELTFDGIKIGDLIYDSFLSCGFATLRSTYLKSRILRKNIEKFFYMRNIIKDIIKRYKIDVSLVSHEIGIDGGVFFKYLLNNGITVWIRGGTLRKYRMADMIRECIIMRHECFMTPEKKYIDFMKSNSSYFLPMANSVLNKRLNSEESIPKPSLAYCREKKVFYSKQDFNEELKLDINKKNVFVMLHAFNDFPHMYGFMIYRDYYEWLEKILEVCKEVDSVNWIFKEHPYSKYYLTKDLNLNNIFLDISLPHIRFISENTNFNTSSLKFVADVILTCIGTAGLEYSAFGIPCVLGGNTFYSGYGFTKEPKTDMEFQDILRNINFLPRLSEEQINIAKLIAFFVFELVEVTKFPDPFATVCTYDIDEQKTFSAEEAFKKIIKRRKESSQEAKNNYIKFLNEFINNENFVQFLDLDKYKFFREMLKEQ